MGLIKKWRSLPAATKSSIAFMLSSFFVTGLSFLTTPIFTRVMPEEQYGIMATYYSWLSIIDVFALLGLTSAGIFNVGLNEHSKNRDAYISSITVLCNTVTVVVFALLFGLKYIFGEDFILSGNLLVLMFIHFLFSPANIFWITRQKYEYKYKLSTVITVASALIGQVVSLVFVLISTSDNLGEVRLWSNELSLLFFYIPIYLWLLIKGKKTFDMGIWKKTLLFAFPLIPHYLAQHVMASVDTIMLTEMVGEAASGVYSVVSTIGKIVTIVWTAINVSLVATIFEALNNNNGDRVSGLVVTIIIGYGAICLIVTLIAPEVLALLAPESYMKGVHVVPPVACASFLVSLYNIYANIEFYHKKPFYIALSTIVATLTNVLFNFLLIPVFTYVGASYTTFISYVVLVFMHFIGYKLCTRGKKLYNDKLIFLVSAIVVGCCLLCNLLYVNRWIRYITILLILTAVLIKHKTIISKIKSLYAKNSEEQNNA